jgi:hypothetical protein
MRFHFCAVHYAASGRQSWQHGTVDVDEDQPGGIDYSLLLEDLAAKMQPPCLPSEVVVTSLSRLDK